MNKLMILKFTRWHSDIKELGGYLMTSVNCAVMVRTFVFGFIYPALISSRFLSQLTGAC